MHNTDIPKFNTNRIEINGGNLLLLLMKNTMMNAQRFYFTIVLLVMNFLSILATPLEGGDYPVEIITNKYLKVTILLPDAEKSYYCSTRFDWSGIIAQVEYEGHTFFQEWENYNGTIKPGNHDPLKAATATGTAEEFRNAPGYAEAKPGEPFLKIGVGILEKADNNPYHWDSPYKIIQPGKWDVKVKKHSICFIQEIKTNFGYAYRYKKTIVLNKNKTELEIRHELENTGKKELHANPYCHNFFQFDDHDIGADYVVEFPGNIKAVDKFDSRVTIENNYLKLNTGLQGNDWVGGHIDSAEALRFTLRNSKTKTSVEVISDVVPGPFYFYIWKLAFCPEPMIEFDLARGEEFSWSRIYKFKEE